MGRPRSSGRTAKSTSVSLLPHTADLLKEHNISATEAVRLYVESVLDSGESRLIERAIQKKEWEIEDLKIKLERAKAREKRVVAMQARR